MNIKLKYLLPALFGSMIAISAFAEKDRDISCPKPKEIVATQLKTESTYNRDGEEIKIVGMSYCAPSANNCTWSGFDSLNKDKLSVKALTDGFEKGKAIIGKNSAICDYILDDGTQLRMAKKLK